MNRMILTTIGILAAFFSIGCSEKDNPVLTDRNLEACSRFRS